LVPPCGIKLQRIRRHERRRIRQPTDGLIACPALRDRPGENALRSARTNLIAPSWGRKDADHKSGGPRYPAPQNRAPQYYFRASRRCCVRFRREYRGGSTSGKPVIHQSGLFPGAPSFALNIRASRSDRIAIR
jgi:hypothetical protein